MKPLRSLIIDDEAPARKRIYRMLDRRDDLSIVGECADGREGLDAIVNLSPDIVFLDIEMPELGGIEVVSRLPKSSVPAVVFVTAYPMHAVKAFELNALDYLLKPFSVSRFDATIDRMKCRISTGEILRGRVRPEASFERPQRDFSGGELVSDRIALKSAGRVHLVKFTEIISIQAARNYVYVKTSRQEYLLRRSMKDLQRQLNPDQFIRIHRSTIINVDCILSMEPTLHGDYKILLNDGSSVPLSRRYRPQMQRLFGDQI